MASKQKISAPVRALSICEPWAWAIAAGHKPIENRTWNTDFRGPVAIHASTSKRYFQDFDAHDFLHDMAGSTVRKQLCDKRITELGVSLFQLGAVVGVAEIVGCISWSHESSTDFDAAVRAAGYGAWYDSHCRAKEPPPAIWAEGPFCILLSNAVQFAEPIAAKGKLNLWNMPPDLAAKVAAALAHGPHGSPVDHAEMLIKAGKLKASPPPPSKPAAAKK